MDKNSLSSTIIGACIKVHQELGPGLFESVYEEVLSYELAENCHLHVQRQQPVPVYYQTLKMEMGFRADLIVEEEVLVELKSVETVRDVHKKQVLTYLKLTGLSLGLLINFNEALLKNGITRIVDNY